MERFRLIRLIESAVFVWGWISVFILGADHPLPSGFVWVVVTVLILAFIQDLYLCWLHEHIGAEKTFLKNTGLFALAGILISNILIIINGAFSHEVWIWIMMITLVSVLYGVFLWTVNLYIVRLLRK